MKCENMRSILTGGCDLLPVHPQPRRQQRPDQPGGTHSPDPSTCARVTGSSRRSVRARTSRARNRTEAMGHARARRTASSTSSGVNDAQASSAPHTTAPAAPPSNSSARASTASRLQRPLSRRRCAAQRRPAAGTLCRWPKACSRFAGGTTSWPDDRTRVPGGTSKDVLNHVEGIAKVTRPSHSSDPASSSSWSGAKRSSAANRRNRVRLQRSNPDLAGRTRHRHATRRAPRPAQAHPPSSDAAPPCDRVGKKPRPNRGITAAAPR